MQSTGKKNWQKDFFISYTHTDSLWATWISQQLEDAGYSTILQAKDFPVGSNFVAEMNKANMGAKRTIMILSPEYLKAPFPQSEWMAAFGEDPTGEHRKLIPIRVKECEIKGLLAAIVRIDIVGLDEVTAKRELLSRIKQLYIEHRQPRGRRSKNSHSTIISFPFPGASSTIKNCPYRRNQLFTGRGEFLENLRKAFDKVDQASQKHPVAICGLTGIGKTQIALEYAYRYLKKYRFILWASATTHDMLSANLANLATLLNLSKEDVKEQEFDIAAVKLYLAEQSGWLLILDDVSDPETIKDLIPLTEQGHILITTQNTRLQEIAQKIELEKMTMEEGAFFLLRKAAIITPDVHFNRETEDAELAMAVSFELDGLPLALDHAGAYIGNTDCGLKGYLERYRDREQLTKLMEYIPYPNILSVAKTFALSFKKINDSYPSSASLLKLCTFFHHDAIPEEIIIDGSVYFGRPLKAATATTIKFDETISNLRSYSLVRRNPLNKTFTIHGLVQTILKDEMNKREYRRWAEKAVRTMCKAFPEVEQATWITCQRYLPHALACVAHIKKLHVTTIEAARLLHRIGQYLLARAEYTEAKMLFTRAHEIYKEFLDAENPEIATLLDNLGSLCMQQGGFTAFTDAEFHYIQALAIRRKIFGPQDIQTAHSLNHLGLLYYNAGKFLQAEPLYEEAQAIQEQIGESQSANLAITLNNLAWLYYNLGNYDKVKPLLEQALSLQERPEESESASTATTLNAFAMLYRSLGQYTEAENYYRRALAIRERVFGQKHPDVATTLNDLAWLYRTLGRFEDAEKLYKQALDIRIQMLGPGHRHVATTNSDIATLYMDQGKYGSAEQLYERVLRIRKNTLGSEHPNVGASLYYIGWLYFHQGRYSDAEVSHNRALEIRKKALGRENLLHVARSYNALAEVYRAQGRYDKAETDCLQALTIREQALIPTHRNVITSIHHLANIYVEQGKYAQADTLYSKALELRLQNQDANLPRMAVIFSDVAKLRVEQGHYAQAEVFYNQTLELYEKVLDEGHPDISDVICNLGLLSILRKKYEQAETYLNRALDERTLSLGKEHPHLGQSYNALGMLYYVQEQYGKAESSYRQALVIREKILGSDHPYVAQTLDNLGLLYLNQEKYMLAEPVLQKSLTIRRQVLGSNHPHTAKSLNNLAYAYCMNGSRYTDASKMYDEALKIDEAVLGPEHPYIAVILTNYASLLRKTNRVAQAKKLENRAIIIQSKHEQENR